jgi:hypothetical protein
MVGEKKEDDIVGRLEALRKKVPATPAEKPPVRPKPAQEPDDKRKKTARIIGIIVILIVLGAIFFVGSKMLGPEETPPPMTTPPTGVGEDQVRLAELAKAKSDKIKEIGTAFESPLPDEYATEESRLIQEVKSKSTKEEVEGVRYESEATSAWRNYRKADVDKKASITGEVVATIGGNLVKGIDSIKEQIDSALLSELKGMTVKELRLEYIPIMLPREQITGGFAEVGDLVNIRYRVEQTINGTSRPKIDYLAKDGKVISIMQAATTIALSESETQTKSGGGSEGKGNVTSLSLGSSGIIISDGPYGASVGYATLSKSNVYSVNLGEIQKAAAASKISKEELLEDLGKYGVTLSEIERDTNIGNLDSEYLMLVEMSEEEASDVVLRLLKQAEKDNILISISKTPSWAS